MKFPKLFDMYNNFSGAPNQKMPYNLQDIFCLLIWGTNVEEISLKKGEMTWRTVGDVSLLVCFIKLRKLSMPLQKMDLADETKSIGDSKIASILLKLHALLLEKDYQIGICKTQLPMWNVELQNRDLLIERFKYHWKFTNERWYCINLRTGMFLFRTTSWMQIISGQIQGLTLSGDRKKDKICSRYLKNYPCQYKSVRITIPGYCAVPEIPSRWPLRYKLLKHFFRKMHRKRLNRSWFEDTSDISLGFKFFFIETRLKKILRKKVKWSDFPWSRAKKSF